MSCEVSDKSKNDSSKADHLNTRIPYGIRPVVKVRSYTLIVFQSTHPVWDATLAALLFSLAFLISIHASRMGCDEDVEPSDQYKDLFQSTHPVWDATGMTAEDVRVNAYFNPRIPYGMRHHLRLLPVSLRDFNPRIPYGMRQHGCALTSVASYFNPRIPYGMRRQGWSALYSFNVFQSTHPVWDATDFAMNHSQDCKFKSTHPVWDATPARFP